MDPNTEDEVTFNYSINGTTMTFTGDIEGTQVTGLSRGTQIVRLKAKGERVGEHRSCLRPQLS